MSDDTAQKLRELERKIDILWKLANICKKCNVRQLTEDLCPSCDCLKIKMIKQSKAIMIPVIYGSPNIELGNSPDTFLTQNLTQ